MNKVKGFNYTKTNCIYIREFKNGRWSEGKLVKDDHINISSMSTSLHYGQQAFEGLKAYSNNKNEISLFRVKDNAKRFQNSCKNLLMPEISVDDFINAVKEVVLANKEFIPTENKSQSLYIRPLMIGVGSKLGVGPASEYLFIIVTSPVGSYFTEIKPIDVLVTAYDRAAPNGTGSLKVGGNYASSLKALSEAKEKGFDDCLFLDPKTHTYIEEVGAANFFGITEDNKYITPKSNSILKSITNDSLRVLAKDYLKLEVYEKNIKIDEISMFKEIGACGTGALITPIGSVTYKNKKTSFNSNKKMIELKDLLLKIQFGEIEDKYNWITKI